MSKKILTKRIILYELTGFGVVILALWLDEVLDLPHYLFGTLATPINWAESIFETVLVLTLGALIILLSWQCLKRIKYLEGFLRVCSFCKRIRVEREWIPIEQYITTHSEAEISHTLCPECTEKHYSQFLRKGKKTSFSA